MSSSNTMSSEESLSVRSISVDVETPETEQVLATVAGLAKLGSMDGGAPLSPPDFSLLHSTPPGGGGDDEPEEPEVSADATPVEENNKGSSGDRGTIPFESISKMSTTSSSDSEGEEEDGGREEGGGGGEITSEMRYKRSRQ